MSSENKEKLSENISVKVEKSLKDKLTEIARRDDRKLSWLVHRILKDYVADHGGMVWEIYEP